MRPGFDSLASCQCHSVCFRFTKTVEPWVRHCRAESRGPCTSGHLARSAHAGSRARVTSMGGLYDAATLRALVSNLALQKSSGELLGTPVWCSLSRLNFRYTRTDARAESSWKTLGKRERMNGRACATSLRARRHGGRHVVCGPSFETPRIAGGRR